MSNKEDSNKLNVTTRSSVEPTSATNTNPTDKEERNITATTATSGTTKDPSATTADTSSQLSYRSGERILCFHGPLLYEAKVLKAEYWNGSDPETPEVGPHYFVHYKGWKQTWDEWVDQSRTLKWNEENLAKQKLLKQNALAAQASAKKKAQMAAASGGGGGGGSGSGSGGVSSNKSRNRQSSVGPSVAGGDTDSVDGSAGGARNRKRSNFQSAETASNADKNAASTVIDDRGDSSLLIKRPEIKVPIPNSLKVVLVNDWEYITKDKLLVPLPRSPTVNDVLEMYRKEYTTSSMSKESSSGASKKSRKDADIAEEVLEGIKLYFDKALGNLLLYRFERYQYQKMLQEYSGKNMSDIYGAEHLLRLFVQMPTLISQAKMDDDAIALLKEYINDLMNTCRALIATTTSSSSTATPPPPPHCPPPLPAPPPPSSSSALIAAHQHPHCHCCRALHHHNQYPHHCPHCPPQLPAVPSSPTITSTATPSSLHPPPPQPPPSSSVLPTTTSAHHFPQLSSSSCTPPITSSTITIEPSHQL
ncbi:Esa1p-associated factor [Mycoemilia scoparia]|uniref:Chromatin modification-related protein EAF3 n=1 Tax=Mycoemilia scoparia TaxID=417184 RepID=A0A9W7ZUN8_9FUNG|nr:Esa1p-associated factor [Mycoemilia scoparia]